MRMRHPANKAVVTGGTHGMGLATVRGLLEGGAERVAHRRNEQNREAACRQGCARGAHVLRSDAASLSDIQALGAPVHKKFGHIDAVFTNAGVSELARNKLRS